MKKKFTYKDILYKSKRIITLGLIVVFGAGLLITSSLNEEVPVHDGDILVDSLAITEGENDEAEDFKTMRAKIELDRNKLIDTLQKTINDSKNEQEINAAKEKKDKIVECMEKEIAIESLISAKGLPNCLAIMSERGISVTVDKQDLDSNTVAKICDIVIGESGLKADKIVIQSKY